MDDFLDQTLLLGCHQVDAGDALDGADLLNSFNTHPDSLAMWIPRLFEPRDHVVGNVDSRHMRAHPAGRTGRNDRTDADDNATTIMQPRFPHARHVALEHLDVEAILSLYELGSGLDLFRQPHRAQIERG